MSEHEEQSNLFEWAELEAQNRPELEYLFAIPNGGWRGPKAGKMMREEGVKPGVPDVFLPIGRGGYLGFFLEIKYGRNKPTALQKTWLSSLDKAGYMTAVCYGFKKAAELLEWYLDLDPTYTLPMMGQTMDKSFIIDVKTRSL